MKPTKELLEKLFSYDPETGVVNRLVGKFGQTGPIKSTQVSVNGKRYMKTHIIWVLVTGSWPTAPIIDHRNGDNTDNRWNNLREATHKQNTYNKIGCGQYPKGVVFKKDAGRKKPWAARIRLANGYKHNLGHYETMEEAAEAYEKAAAIIQKDFALNESMKG